MIQIIIKLIEFLLHPGLIPSQRNLMDKKIFLMLTKSRFENIKPGMKWSSIKVPSIQVLHQQISEVLVCADSADAGEGAKIAENMLT